MNNLELKDIYMYLPYGLKIDSMDSTMVGLDNERIELIHDEGHAGWVYFEEAKPILRPLSDLTKEIEHNGERFKAAYRLHLWQEQLFRIQKRNSIEPYEMPYNVVTTLISWHFDINNLIAQGKAISIHEI